MGVHAVAVDAVKRLGHEGGVQAVLLGDRLQRRAEGDRVVGGAHRIVVFEVDLVLADGHFVVASFDDDAQLFERFDHLLAHVGGFVGGQVEVAGLVVRQRLDLRQAVLFMVEAISRPAAEHEKLQLRSGHIPKAHVLGTLELAPQHTTRVASEGLAVGCVHVADHFGGGPVRIAFPGDDAEGIEVRIEEHVALVDAREAFDARTVEPQAVVDRVAKLVEGDMDVLNNAHDVGELQTDESHVGRRGLLEHALLRRNFVRGRDHGCSVPYAHAALPPSAARILSASCRLSRASGSSRLTPPSSSCMRSSR